MIVPPWTVEEEKALYALARDPRITKAPWIERLPKRPTDPCRGFGAKRPCRSSARWRYVGANADLGSTHFDDRDLTGHYCSNHLASRALVGTRADGERALDYARKAPAVPKTSTSTVGALLAGLLAEAGAETAYRAGDLPENPLAWEGARNALDRIRGVEIARMVASDAELLEKSDLDSWRKAYEHFRTARLAVLVSGGSSHVAKGIEEAGVKAAGVVESFYVPAGKRFIQA